MLKEFKEFALRGNMVDMAVGIIIGGAFGKIITSLVNDIVMPPLGLLLGKVDFNNLYLNLSSTPYESLQAAQEAGAPTLNYGSFISTVISFTIIAFSIFMMIKAMNRLRRKKEKEPTPAPQPSPEEKLLTEIRDALRKS